MNEYETADVARIPERTGVRRHGGGPVSLCAIVMAYRLITGRNMDPKSSYAAIGNALHARGHAFFVDALDRHKALWVGEKLEQDWLPKVCTALVLDRVSWAEQYPLVKQYAEQTDAGYSAVLDAKL